MKIKKFALASLIAVLLIMALASVALAGTYVCIVTATGPGGATATFVRLTDTAATPAFTNRWFKFRSDRAKEMLAVALTAMANNKKVRATLVSTDAYATVNEFMIVSD